MYFDELSNEEWALLKPVISDGADNRLTRRGRPRVEPRVVVNAVLWVMTTGEPWSRLPCGYPSGPTCRCRFEEWRANGTLSEMIGLLAKNGRKFAYIPTQHSPDIGRSAPNTPRFLRDDGAPQVLWKSPESWQTLHGASDRTHETSPFAEIARQLTGREHCCRVEPESDTVVEIGCAPQAQRTEYAPWMGLLSRGRQVTDIRGYVIFAAADSLASESFRAWAEIVKGGRRVARSGLIGPRFADIDAAQRYALNWARSWIDEQCPVPAVSERLGASAVVRALPRPQPVARAPVHHAQDELCHEGIRMQC